MKVGIVIQARLSSTRLPNKVLKELYSNSTTIIKEIVDRSLQVTNVDDIIVATSNQAVDNPLEDYINKNLTVKIFRGSEENVLDRYCKTAKKFDLEHVVRLTGDNPCIDPALIEKTISNHLQNEADYTYTTGYPIGMNIEVVSAQSLYLANREGVSRPDKEHVTFYIRNNPKVFKVNIINTLVNNDISALRLTIDNPEDYLMLRILFDFLKSKNKFFGLREIENLYLAKPYIFDINSKGYQKQVFKDTNEEYKAALKILKNQELFQSATIIQQLIEE